MIGMMKATLWEEAKGKLRAVAAMAGQTVGEEKRWVEIDIFIENFIREFEGHAYEE